MIKQKITKEQKLADALWGNCIEILEQGNIKL